MLIKASRIRTSSGADAIARHLTNGDDNESIEIVHGTVADLNGAVDDARRFNRLYCLRHFIIAPEIPMDRQQFYQAARALGDEFGFDPDVTFIVEHQKSRAVARVADRHWHIVVAETDPATGRVLSSRFDHARHEKVSRILELMFGHPIVAGAHDAAVLAALRSEGRNDLADQLDVHLAQDRRPVAAFSTEQHQAAKRGGIDLALVRESIRTGCADGLTGSQLRDHLARQGLVITQGDKPGVWIVRGMNGQFLGAAHRLAGRHKADFNSIMENNHGDQPNHNSASDSHGYTSDQERRGNSSRTGEEHGVADARRERFRSGNDGAPIANDSERRGAKSAESGSSASEVGRAGYRERLAENDRHRLMAATRSAADALSALTVSTIDQSPLDRVLKQLGEQEAQARIRIAAAEPQVSSQASEKLRAAQIYKQSTGARYDAAFARYKEVQEQLTIASETRQTMMDRLLGRKAESFDIDALKRDLAKAHAELVAADRALGSATGILARAEKAEASANMENLKRREMERRSCTETLTEIALMKNLVQTFPSLAYSGPEFIVWAGRKIQKRRRRNELANPFATDIWGIPLDFG